MTDVPLRKRNDGYGAPPLRPGPGASRYLVHLETYSEDPVNPVEIKITYLPYTLRSFVIARELSLADVPSLINAAFERAQKRSPDLRHCCAVLRGTPHAPTCVNHKQPRKGG